MAAKKKNVVRLIRSSERIIMRRRCKRGHDAAKYSVVNVQGYVRCKRCMALSQRRYWKRQTTAAKRTLLEAV